MAASIQMSIALPSQDEVLVVLGQAGVLLALPFITFLYTLKVANARALLLLVVPFVAALTGLLLSVMQGAEHILLSDSLNFVRPEPWAFWIVRYTLWHMAFAGIWSFKAQVLPTRMKWLAHLVLLCSLTCIWSLFSQSRIALNNPFSYQIHVASAVATGFIVAVESLIFWARGWPAIAYCCVCVGYFVTFLSTKVGLIGDTGIPYVHQHVGLPLEWAMLGGYVVLLYTNYPRLQKEGCLAYGEEKCSSSS